MTDLLQDLRFAARKLVKAPAFTLAVLATLAIGIGATTAIFSTVNAALLRPLPFAHPEDLVALRTAYTDGRVTTGLVAAAELARLHDPNLSITSAVAMGAAPLDATLLRDNADPVHAALTFVSEGFFELFGLPMTLGSSFPHDLHVPTRNPGGVPIATVLSYRVWNDWFGRDPQIVGKTVRFAELAATVSGVANRDLAYPDGADFWMNLRTDPQDVGHGLMAIVRVKPRTPIDRLRGELGVVMAGLARDFPLSDAGRVFVAQPLVRSIVGDLGPILLVVLAATGLLLLLACVNVTNLLLARGASRGREIAVRAAIGASRGRIVRQLLTESFLATALGAVVGLLLAYVGVRLLQTLGASKLPRLESVPFDGRVLAFALLALIGSGLGLGVAPALRLARTDIKALIDGGRTASSGRSTSRAMGSLIVAEVALAITLVAGAGWLVESFSRLRSTDPGFVPDGRLIVDVRPNPRAVRGGEQAIAWSQNLFDHLRALPGVVGIGSTLSFPLRGNLDGSLFVQFQGDAFDPSHPAGARARLVTPGFFDAMGIKIVAGRDFTRDDRQNTMPVTIVNREFVKRYLVGKDPLQTQFAAGYPTIDTKTFRSIVGVVGDVRYRAISEDAEPSFYLTQGQAPFPRQTVVVATQLPDPTAAAPAIRAELGRLEPQLAVDVQTVSSLVAGTLTRQELGMVLMLVFGATALALAAVGIYGVIAYASAQRRAEIATRLALGATAGDVFWLLMKRGQILSAAGAILGLAAAYAAGRAVASSLYGVQASDVRVLLTAPVVVVLITLLATAVPARRAARTDPVLVLRGE